jgi:hypothetical protein
VDEEKNGERPHWSQPRAIGAVGLVLNAAGREKADEAPMAEDRPDLALAKFAEANQYTPRWGRLHLKRGDALIYVGRPGEASRQFTMASGLDLTAGERSELTRTGAVDG